MRKIGKIGRAIVLIICTVFILICINNTLAFKSSDGVTPIKDLYNYEENSIDVLLLGSSHMGMNVDAAKLYDEYGIASYCLWGSMQPLWNSYFYLKEALKTQVPRLVVLETYGASFEDEFSDYSRVVKNVSGMRLSQNKIDAIKVSASEDLWLDLLLQLPVSHSRYDELTETDFMYYPWSEKNLVDKHTHAASADIVACIRPELDTVTESAALFPKSEEYLMKIIHLLDEMDIPLLLISSPYPISAEEQMKQLRVGEIAGEGGVPFIDYNQLYDEIGLDFQTDFRDTVHLNYSGTQKVTAHLGKYMTDNFDLPDRRDDENYKSWQEFAVKTRSEHLKSINRMDWYFEDLAKNNYLCIIVVDNRSAEIQLDESVHFSMLSMGIENPQEIFEPDYAVYVSDGKNCLFSERYVTPEDICIELNDIELDIDLADEGITAAADGEAYRYSKKGMSVLVYDTEGRQVMDTVSFQIYSGYGTTRSGIKKVS